MYEQEILKNIVTRTSEEVEIYFRDGTILRLYPDGIVLKSMVIFGCYEVERYRIINKHGDLKPDVMVVNVNIAGQKVLIAKKKLIGLVFLGLPERKNMVLRNIDGNKKNIAVSNLEWVTWEELSHIKIILRKISEYGYKIKRNFYVKDYRELKAIGYEYLTVADKWEDALNIKKIVCYINGDKLPDVLDEETPQVICWDIWG